MKTKLFFTLLFALLFLENTVTAQTIRYVTEDGTGSGTSWGDASGNFQAMVDASAAGDQVWVAKGEYPAPENSSFTMKAGVKIYGHFSGVENSLSERDTLDILVTGSLNATILKSSGSRTITNIENGLTATALLDGFIITGNGNNAGGGMHNKNASPTIVNCVFTDNFTDNGAGIFNESASSPTLTNVVISNNNAGDFSGGGGMFNSSSSPTLTNVVISNNNASGSGAGIYNESASSPTLTNVVISNNNASGSGGGMRNADSSPTLTNVVISNNNASGFGGGMYNNDSSPTLTNVVISNNKASVSGGGMYNFNSSLTLTNAAITHNRTESGGGGGMRSYATTETITLDNVTFYGNGPEDNNDTSLGRDIFIEATSGGTHNINNSIIGSRYAIQKDPGAAVNYTHSLIEHLNDHIGTNIGNDGGGMLYNISPQFVDPENGDFHLQAGSPVIDMGDNSLVTETRDIEGKPRISGNNVDMGAYELQQSTVYPNPDNGVLYVDQSVSGGNGSGDGWANALPELADALKYAKENVSNWTATNPLQIWVATGTYKPLYTPEDGQNFSTTPTDLRDKAFLMVKNVQLYGGFDPDNGIVDLTHDRILPSSGGAGGGQGGTMLSGDFNDNDQITGSGVNLNITGNDENAYHVLISANDIGIALVDGFALNGGNANGNSSNFIVNGQNINRQQGGGIHKNSSSLSLTNVEISGNIASGDGGGIYNNGTGTSYLTNVAISGNIAFGYGGGIANLGTINLTNVAISGNVANDGGGISNLSSGPINLNNVEISENTANYGGGIYNGGSSLKLTNVTLANNSAGNDGDGIFINLGSEIITNSIVWNDIIIGLGGSNTSQNSIIMGSSDTDYGNIDATGLTAADIFTDAANGDFSLVLNSPAIDAGDNTLYTDANGNLQNDLDLAGNPRVYDEANGGIIDMGAYEFTASTIIIWMGTESNNWDTATNWNGSIVPSTTDDVLIPVGATQMPTLSATTTVNSVTMESGTSLVLNDELNGALTVQRELTDQWHLISSPVTGETQEDYIADHTLATGTGSNIGLAPYDTATDSWAYATNAATGTFDSGSGFSTLLNAAGTVSFTGTMPSGTPSVAMLTGGVGNFNLVGNPFPSYISIDDVISNNSTVLDEQTLWLWDGTSYVTVNYLEGGNIAPVQGFFVSAFSAGSFEFDPALQSHDVGSFYKTTTEDYIKLTLSVTNGSLESSSRIYLLDGMTTAFDNGYDGSMFTGTLPELGIYTHSVADDVDNKLAIQALPVPTATGIEEMVIPVGIITAEGSEGQDITFSLSEINNLPEDVDVYLEDVQNAAITQLSAGETYEATINEGEAELGRFFIHFSNATFSTDDMVESNGPQMLLIEGSILLLSKVEENANLTIYNLLGQAIWEQDIKAAIRQSIKLSLSTGAYIAKLEGQGVKVTKKIIVSQ